MKRVYLVEPHFKRNSYGGGHGVFLVRRDTFQHEVATEMYRSDRFGPLEFLNSCAAEREARDWADEDDRFEQRQDEFLRKNLTHSVTTRGEK